MNQLASYYFKKKSLGSPAEGNIPIDVHVFKRADHHYAFDTRNFSILRLDPLGASILSQMKESSLDELIDLLGSICDNRLIESYYTKFLKMLEDGVFSRGPVRQPKKPPFYRLVAMVAGGCNMGCKYCFEKDVPTFQNANLMSKETADEMLHWYFRHHEGSKAHLQIYGGEPLLNWPVAVFLIEQMESWAAAKQILFTKYLITNGTLLTESQIDFFKDHHLSVQISADGDAKTHDRLRTFKSGQATMKCIQPNILKLKNQGVDFNLRAVITRKNPNSINVIDGLRSLGGQKVSFEIVAVDDIELQFDDNDWMVFNAHHEKQLSAPFDSWHLLPAELQSAIIQICEGKRLYYGCGAGVNEITVAPDGSLYECQRMYRTARSHISRNPDPQAICSLQTMVENRPICKDCWARYLCGGGCMHQAHIENGNEDPPQRFCQMKFETYENAIAKIHELRSRENTQAE